MAEPNELIGRAGRSSPVARVRWLPGLLFALFVLGFFAGTRFLHRLPVSRRLEPDGRYGLWVIVMGLACGLALSSACYFGFVIKGIGELAGGLPTREQLIATSWVVLTLATVLGTLFLGARDAGDSIDRTLAGQTRPVVLALGLCLAPGLVALLLVRVVADRDGYWDEDGRNRVRLVLRLRRELRQLLVVLGAFLTLLVIATGLRRQALLGRYPQLELPPASVLLYGLTFAVLLGSFFLAGSSAVDARAARVVAEFAPLPAPDLPELSAALARRRDLGELVGIGTSWRTFQSVVIVAAPLLTGLIASASGG